MADFAPQVPASNDPNFFRFSEPIKPLEPNKAAGLALATAGQAIETGANLVKTTAEDWIKEDVRNTVTPIRDKFTNDLLQTRYALDPTQPTPPDVLKTQIDKLSTLKDAFVNGHVNDTYYHMQLDKGVTDLRSRYPGFKDFIDTEVSKITGVTPANAVINDLMQDINRAQTSKKTEQDKIVDLARGAMTKGFDKAQQQYEKLIADPSYTATFLKWYTEENAKDTEQERKAKALAYKAASQKDIKEDDAKLVSDWVGSKIDSDLNATMTLTGMNKPERVMDILRQASEKPDLYSGEQMEEFATKMQAQRDLMKAQLIQLSRSDPNIRDSARRVGIADLTTEIDNQVKVYDSMYNSIRGGGSGGAGLAFYQMNQARAIMDHTKYNLTSGDMGKWLNNFQIMSEKLGPLGTSNWLIPQLLKSQSNLPEQLRGLFGEKVTEAVAQPNDKQPTTFTQHAAEIANDKRINPQERAQLYNELIKTISTLKSSSVSNEAKESIAKYFFDPKNNALLPNFKMDYETPTPDRKGTIVHPGMYSVWNQLTDKDTTEAVNKMDDKYRQMYRSWVDITGRELIGNDVRTLNHFTGHDNLYFEWHNNGTGTPQLVLKDKEGALPGVNLPLEGPYGVGSVAAPPSKGYIYQVNQVVKRINSALPNLERVYKQFGGGDTETMLLQTLQQYGLNFEGKIEGLPKAFGDSIAASRKAPKPEKKEEK